MATVSRKPLSAQDLNELIGFRPLYTGLKVTLNLSLLALFTALAWFNTESVLLDWVFYVAAGYMWMAVTTMMHDCTHNTLFKTRWFNYAFGVISMIPLLVSYLAFKEDHLEHHRYNRSYKDPDAFTMGKRGVLDFVAFYAYILVGGALTFLHFNFLYPIRSFNRRQWAAHIAELVLKWGWCWALVTWAKANGILDPVLEVWLYPVLVFSWINSIRFIVEHYGTPWNQGKLAGTRTVISNPVNAFFWNNINWHIGHHLYPRVPYYNLVKLHDKLLPEMEAAGCVIDRSYIGVFCRALVSGPESEPRLEKALRQRAESGRGFAPKLAAGTPLP